MTRWGSRVGLVLSLALGVVCGLAAVSAAQDADPALEKPDADAIVAEVEAAAEAGDLDRVRMILGTLFIDGRPRDRDTHLEAAAAARAYLPRAEANALESRYLGELIVLGVRDPEFDLREKQARQRYLRELDVAAGAHLLRSWLETYPDAHNFRYDLGLLYMDGGRPDLAHDAFAEYALKVPSSKDAARWLAVLDQELGRPRDAMERYDDLIRNHGDIDSYRYKAHIQAYRLHDTNAALATLAQAQQALAELAPGEERDRLAARISGARRDIEQRAADREKLREIRDDVNGKVNSIAIAWLAFLLAGGVVLKLRNLI